MCELMTMSPGEQQSTVASGLDASSCMVIPSTLLLVTTLSSAVRYVQTGPRAQVPQRNYGAMHPLVGSLSGASRIPDDLRLDHALEPSDSLALIKLLELVLTQPDIFPVTFIKSLCALPRLTPLAFSSFRARPIARCLSTFDREHETPRINSAASSDSSFLIALAAIESSPRPVSVCFNRSCSPSTAFMNSLRLSTRDLSSFLCDNASSRPRILCKLSSHATDPLFFRALYISTVKALSLSNFFKSSDFSNPIQSCNVRLACNEQRGFATKEAHVPSRSTNQFPSRTRHREMAPLHLERCSRAQNTPGTTWTKVNDSCCSLERTTILIFRHLCALLSYCRHCVG
jgi:hypothetical protein